MKQQDNTGKITITLEVDVEYSDIPKEEFAARVQDRIEDFMRSGAATTADQEISWQTRVSHDGDLLRNLANLDLWEEAQIEDAIDKFGLRSPDEIREHVEAAQSDLDYLVARDDTLTSLIKAARRELSVDDTTVEDVLRERGLDADIDRPEP